MWSVSPLWLFEYSFAWKGIGVNLLIKIHDVVPLQPIICQLQAIPQTNLSHVKVNSVHASCIPSLFQYRLESLEKLMLTDNLNEVVVGDALLSYHRNEIHVYFLSLCLATCANYYVEDIMLLVFVVLKLSFEEKYFCTY